MCLGVPGKVVEVKGLKATVDFWGVRKQVRLDVVDQPVTPGDYVLNHVGFAIRRIPAEDGMETLKFYHKLLRLQGEEDRMSADVRDRLHTAGPGWWRSCEPRF
jgi:hydrogenase expression/formation protein HypC